MKLKAIHRTIMIRSRSGNIKWTPILVPFFIPSFQNCTTIYIIYTVGLTTLATYLSSICSKFLPMFFEFSRNISFWVKIGHLTNKQTKLTVLNVYLTLKLCKHSAQQFAVWAFCCTVNMCCFSIALYFTKRWWTR